MSDRFPMPMPFGWFAIGYTDELAVGDVKNIHYFDRDMVLFRTELGELGLTDPYCPHLGAHLGYGGEVTGESIRCPFHHWSYDNKGFVTDVPYAKQIPPKAQGKSCLKVYPVLEKSQVIWAWYHPEEVEPFFSVIENPEVADPDWTPLERYQWTYNSNPQEIAENGIDVAHFKYIHKAEAVPEGESTYEGVIRRTRAFGPRVVIDKNGKEKTIMGGVEVTQNGAGQKWTLLKGVVDRLLLVLVTPIDDETVEMRFAFSSLNYEKGSYEYNAVREGVAATISAERGLEADIRIWRNKIHLREPLLCDGDGAIMQFRKYFEQFYVDGPYGDEPEKLKEIKSSVA